ncbi:hypothetical protein GCM10023310_68940 [Paenibacillus vulneris]|uniref:Uncharacterized protein n=1 Tax=Paenibacillus vulneris TaxID=1133364 RepID=A0ABW3UJG0_9BACL
MLEFLIYLFLLTGSASFIAELTWRITHWKVKNSVINCTIQNTDKFNVEQAAI